MYFCLGLHESKSVIAIPEMAMIRISERSFVFFITFRILRFGTKVKEKETRKKETRRKTTQFRVSLKS